MKIAIAFLTTEIQRGTLTFAYQLAQRINADVYVIADDEGPGQFGLMRGSVYIGGMVNVQRPTEFDCKKHGYINSVTGTHINKACCAIDKALYFFCEVKNEYDFVLLIEDDVFVPSLEAVKNLIDKSKAHDLVVSKLEKKSNDNAGWTWGTAKIDAPLYRTMGCVTGMSRNMLNEISVFVSAQGTLCNSEILWPTLAVKCGLSVFCPPELRTILWEAGWSVDDALCLPNSFLHPYKNFDNHDKLRELIRYAHEIEYKPANKLPKFLKGEE